MNKLLSIVLFGAALSLTACGGDSDSSGDSRYDSETIPAKFQGLPNCEIGSNSLIEQDFFRIDVSNNGRPTCLVKVPDLNNGRTFSLACTEDSTSITILNDIIEDGKSNRQSINDDIAKFVAYVNDDSATTSDSKYGYSCNID